MVNKRMTYTMNTCTWLQKSKKKKNLEPLETHDR